MGVPEPPCQAWSMSPGVLSPPCPRPGCPLSGHQRLPAELVPSR